MFTRAGYAGPSLAVRDFAWASVVLVLGLALTFWAWRFAEESAAADARRRFDLRVSEISAALVGRMASYEQVLRGGLGLMLGSNEVTQDEWRRYVEALDLQRDLPGVQGLGYSKWIPPADLEAFVRRVRAQGLTDFEVHPAGLRDAYTAIVFLEPLNRRNQAALGFDMWSEPVRRAAMAAARDRAMPVVSGRVRLVQEIDADVQPGFLMYIPHYGTPAPPPTVEERRRALLGFVYSPFRMRDFMRGIDFGGLHDIRVEIFDGAAAHPEALLYDSRPDADAPARGLERTVAIPLPGHRWTARFGALPARVRGAAEDRSTIILAAGAVISLLFFGIAASLARSRRAAALNERLGRIIEDSVSEVYVFEPERLRILQANRGARTNLGYGIDEVRTLALPDLTPAYSHAAFEALLRPLRDGRERQLRLQTAIRRKDGSTYEAEIDLQFSRITRPPVFTAIVQDITERRRAEERQRLLMDELNHRVKNTLAIVQSLAMRTLQGQPSPESFVPAFKARLAALATSHTLLTRTYWTGASLRDLVLRHLDPYRTGSGRDVAVEGPPVLLKPAAALALGLALHELATNAAKHGALSTPTGRVRVGWRVEPGADHPVLILDWIESGGPPVRPDPGRGFGLTVIERGLAYELDGRAELNFRPGGLHCRIAITMHPDLAETVAAPPAEARGEARQAR